jgi:hypothetical protein
LSESDLLFCLLAGSCCQVQIAGSQQFFGWAPVAAARLPTAAAGLPAGCVMLCARLLLVCFK